MVRSTIGKKFCGYAVALLLSFFSATVAQANDPIVFDDAPLVEDLPLPEWFKLSFLDLQEDILESRRGRRGLIVYFGMSTCPYCKAHLENNWGKRDIVAYTRAHFDVVAVDVLGQRPVTDVDGRSFNEKSYAIAKKADFTPSLLIFDKDGKEALRVSGYRPPYQFRAILEYVADGHHKKENFGDYLARAETAFSFGKEELNPNPVFMPGSHDLQKRDPGKLLLAFFERGRCHACDVLHAGPMVNEHIQQHLKALDVIQVDMQSDAPITLANGNIVSEKQWANALGLNYAPTLIFFDARGQEIIRIDSVVWFYRLNGVLNYVLSGDYKTYPSFQAWRQARSQ
ncbi:MAG: thioredoxin fold domain-containing protein [Gammaproteobacteria bacterium]